MVRMRAVPGLAVALRLILVPLAFVVGQPSKLRPARLILRLVEVKERSREYFLVLAVLAVRPPRTTRIPSLSSGEPVTSISSPVSAS